MVTTSKAGALMQINAEQFSLDLLRTFQIQWSLFWFSGFHYKRVSIGYLLPRAQHTMNLCFKKNIP
jgi:hypothetical protein